MLSPKIKRLHMCDQNHKWYEQIYWPYSPSSSHNSKHMFDIYSLTHIFWPAIFTHLLKKITTSKKMAIIVVFIISSLFEIYENMPEQIIKYQRVEINSSRETSYRGDSTINVIGDILANIAGIYLGNYCPWTTVITTFFIITNTIGLNYWKEFVIYLFSKG